MECEASRDVDLHQVRRVAEVRPSAANDLLEAGWILHDIYFSTDGEYRSVYILLSMEEPICPTCGGVAKVEVVDFGDRVRFICTRECGDPYMAREAVLTG